jgi:hypothetical protein
MSKFQGSRTPSRSEHRPKRKRTEAPKRKRFGYLKRQRFGYLKWKRFGYLKRKRFGYVDIDQNHTPDPPCRLLVDFGRHLSFNHPFKHDCRSARPQPD